MIIPLILLLAAIGAPTFSEARGVDVTFHVDGPEGILGVACDYDTFGHVEGNAQSLCTGVPDGTVVLFTATIFAQPDPFALLRNIIRHEAEHLSIGAGDGHDPFQERRAYQAGCTYQWHDLCHGWGATR